MYSAKIWATDPLYSSLNSFLAHVVPHTIVISSRSDYRDPSYMKVSLDYGTYTIDLKEYGVKSKVDHRAPTDDCEAYLLLQSESYDQNVTLVDLAIRSYVKTPNQRVVSVYSWENGWHQRQAIFVAEYKPSKTQQRVLDAIDWFYKNPQHFHDHGLPYQRGILISGPSAAGKHWTIRQAALTHLRSMCYLPISEGTFSTVGPAIACAPLNSIVVLDGLVQFYQHIPAGERGVFLRHLESVFNTSVCDPRGLLIVLLSPSNIPPELERFLSMPHRFQKKFELSLAGHDQLTSVLQKYLTDTNGDVLERLSKVAANAQVSAHVLSWFFAEHLKDGVEPKCLVAMVEDLVYRIKEERSAIDLALPGHSNRDRMYS